MPPLTALRHRALKASRRGRTLPGPTSRATQAVGFAIHFKGGFAIYSSGVLRHDFNGPPPNARANGAPRWRACYPFAPAGALAHGIPVGGRHRAWATWGYPGALSPGGAAPVPDKPRNPYAAPHP